MFRWGGGPRTPHPAVTVAMHCLQPFLLDFGFGRAHLESDVAEEVFLGGRSIASALGAFFDPGRTKQKKGEQSASGVRYAGITRSPSRYAGAWACCGAQVAPQKTQKHRLPATR